MKNTSRAAENAVFGHIVWHAALSALRAVGFQNNNNNLLEASVE